MIQAVAVVMAGAPRKSAAVNQQMRLIKLASHQQVELIKWFIFTVVVVVVGIIPELDERRIVRWMQCCAHQCHVSSVPRAHRRRQVH